MRPAFLQEARAAGEGWVFGAPFTDPGSVSGAFRSAHRAAYGTAPGRWAAEAYDAVGLVARALESLDDPAGGYFLYRAEGNSFRFLGRNDRITGRG
jgi:ABC-type branched-subunit amino acid transport system substrate-binding protein